MLLEKFFFEAASAQISFRTPTSITPLNMPPRVSTAGPASSSSALLAIANLGALPLETKSSVSSIPDPTPNATITTAPPPSAPVTPPITGNVPAVPTFEDMMKAFGKQIAQSMEANNQHLLQALAQDNLASLESHSGRAAASMLKCWSMCPNPKLNAMLAKFIATTEKEGSARARSTLGRALRADPELKALAEELAEVMDDYPTMLPRTARPRPPPSSSIKRSATAAAPAGPRCSAGHVGHLDAQCWSLHPELKPEKKAKMA